MGPLCIISFTSTIALLKYNSYATPLSHLKHIIHWFWYIQICGTITTINYKDIVMSPPPKRHLLTITLPSPQPEAATRFLCLYRTAFYRHFT